MSARDQDVDIAGHVAQRAVGGGRLRAVELADVAEERERREVALDVRLGLGIGVGLGLGAGLGLGVGVG